VATPFDAIAGAPNACQVFPNLLTAGQPHRRQLEALAALGDVLVLDLRDPAEPREFDEPALARELGLDYVNIPISQHTLTDDSLERILRVLREHESRTVFFHCASASRVGGALVAHFMLDHGWNEERAVREAMRVGLRSPAYLQWALGYVARQRRGDRPQA